MPSSPNPRNRYPPATDDHRGLGENCTGRCPLPAIATWPAHAHALFPQQALWPTQAGATIPHLSQGSVEGRNQSTRIKGPSVELESLEAQGGRHDNSTLDYKICRGTPPTPTQMRQPSVEARNSYAVQTTICGSTQLLRSSDHHLWKHPLAQGHAPIPHLTQGSVESPSLTQIKRSSVESGRTGDTPQLRTWPHELWNRPALFTQFKRPTVELAVAGPNCVGGVCPPAAPSTRLVQWPVSTAPPSTGLVQWRCPRPFPRQGDDKGRCPRPPPSTGLVQWTVSTAPPLDRTRTVDNVYCSFLPQGEHKKILSTAPLLDRASTRTIVYCFPSRLCGTMQYHHCWCAQTTRPRSHKCHRSGAYNPCCFFRERVARSVAARSPTVGCKIE